MSNKVDERITRIRFDNDQFEKGVATSLQSIDRLKNKLESTESVQAFTGIQNAADKTDLSGIAKAVDNISDKFSILRGIAIGVLTDIVTKAVSAGESMVKALSVDNIAAGWQKYDSEVQAVQTIMVTLEDTPIEEIEKALEKVGWFSDETSYSYEQMVNSMAKFISSGVSLQDATDAVIGLANASAAAGVSTKKAEHIFYNFSQAMGAGFMGLADWRSVELQNMATPEFKRNIINTALALNKIVKVGDDLYATAENLNNPNNWFSSLSMRTSLSEKWLDADVMREVLKQYEGFTDQVYKIQHDPQYNFDQASEAMDYLEDMGLAIQDVSNKAFRAAQEAKTFAEAVDATKDAVGTKWKDTFKELFGDYEQAKVLWTDFSEALYDLFAASGDVRNEILKQWNDPLTFLLPDQRIREAFAFPELQEGRDILIEGLWNIWNSIVNVVDTIKAAWREVFPAMTAKRLYDLTKRFRDFTAKILDFTENLDGFQGFLVGVFKVFRKVLDLGKSIFSFAKKFWPIVERLWTLFIKIADAILNFGKSVADFISANVDLEPVITAITDGIQFLCDRLDELNGMDIKLPAFQTIVDASGNVVQALTPLKTIIQDVFGYIWSKFTGEDVEGSISGITSAVQLFGEKSESVGYYIGYFLGNLVDMLIEFFSFLNVLLGKGLELVGTVINWVRNIIQDFSLGSLLKIFILGGIAKFIIGLAQAVVAIIRIGSSFAWALDSIASIINAKAWQMRADVVKKVATSILIIAGALFLVSKIEPTQMWASINAIMTIVACIMAMYLVVKIVDEFYAKSEKVKRRINVKNYGFVGIGLAVLAMAAAMKMIADSLNKEGMTVNKILGSLAIIAAMLGALTTISILLTRFSGDKRLGMSVFYPLTMALSILVMIRAFKKIDELEIENVGKVVLTLIGFLGTLFVAGLLMRKISARAGIGLILFAITFKMILSSFESIESMAFEFNRRTFKILAAVIGIMTLFTAFFIVLRLVGDAKKFGAGRMLAFAASMILLSASFILISSAFRILGKLKWTQILRGIVVLISAIGGMATILAIANRSNVFTPGSIIALGIFSIALSVLMGSVGALAKAPITGIWVSALALVATVGILTVMLLAVSNSKTKFNGSLISLTFISLALSVLILALKALSKEDIGKTWSSVGVLGVILLELLGVLYILGKMQAPALKAIPTIITISLMAGLLGGMILLFGSLADDTESMIQMAIAIGFLAGTLSATVLMLSRLQAAGNFVNYLAVLAEIALMGAVFGGLLALMTAIAKDNNLSWIKEYGVHILGFIVVIAALTAVAGVIGAFGPAALGAIAIGGVALALGVVILIGLLALIYAAYLIMTDGINMDEFKANLLNLIEISYLMGSVFSAFVYGLFKGYKQVDTKHTTDYITSLIPLAKQLEPLGRALNNIPINFSEKASAFKEGIKELKKVSGEFKNSDKFIDMLDTLKTLAPTFKEIGEKISDTEFDNLETLSDAVTHVISINEAADNIRISEITAITEKLSPLISNVADIDVSDLKDAINNAGTIVEFISPFDDILTSFGKITGSQIDNFDKTVESIKKIPENFPIEEFASFGSSDLTTAKTNAEKIAKLLEAFNGVTIDFGREGGVWGWLAGEKANSFDKLPEFADAVIRYGRKLMATDSVPYITAATNVTNSLGDAFHNLVSEDMTSRLQSLSTAISQLSESGIDKIQYMFSDEITARAVSSALGNLIEAFRIEINAEIKNNRIASFLQMLYSTILDSVSYQALNFYLRGKLLHDEFIRGIKGESFDAEAAGIVLTKGLKKGTAEGLEAKSPSRVMFAYGEYAGIGLANGVVSTEGMVENAGLVLSKGLLNSIRGNLDINSPSWETYLLGQDSGIGFGNGFLDAIAGSNLGEKLKEILSEQLGGVFNLDGTAADPNKLVDEFLIKPVQNKREELKKLIGDITLEDLTSGNLQQKIGEAFGNTIFGSLESSAISSAHGEAITAAFLKNMPGVTNVDEVLADVFTPVPSETWVDQLFNGEDLFDWDTWFSDWEDSYLGLSKTVSDNPIESVFTDGIASSYLPSSYDYQSLASAATGGGTVAGYTSEDIRALTTEIHGLEDALYSLKETMKEQHMIHSGEIQVKYTNESEFVDRIQTAIITSMRREARG